MRKSEDNMKSSTAVSMNTSPGTEAIFKCAVGRDDIYTGRPKKPMGACKVAPRMTGAQCMCNAMHAQHKLRGP
jgi:hypothetical protein